MSQDITFLLALKTVFDGFLIGAAIMGGILAVSLFWDKIMGRKSR